VRPPPDAAGDERRDQHNVAAVLERRMHARRVADRTAFRGDGQPEVSHLDVHDRSARAAEALRRMGIAEGSRVALRARDSVSWVVAFLACARLGALVGIISTDLTDEATEQQYRDFRPDLILAERDARGLDPGALEVEARGCDPCEPSPLPPHAPLYVQYTSGTTGAPKGAVHTHAHVLAYATAFGDDVLGLTPDDVCLSASRMYFAYGFVNSVVFPLASGASAVLSSARPTPSKLAGRCRDHGVTVVFAVPSLYARLASIADEDGFRSVRVGVSGGERLQGATRAGASALLGAPILDCLGSTEMGYTYCANRLSAIAPGSVGHALAGYEIELREDGNVLTGDDQEGDVWVRGPSLMLGYLDAPASTAEVVRDGWLWTKDRARRAEGSHWVLGRVDDVEIVGAVKVDPLEIEAVLVACDGVAEVAVVGRADAEGLTRLYAYVVPEGPDQTSLVQAVTTVARATFATEPHKIPREVTVVESLPRTPTGKLQRFALRRTLEVPPS
jgi:4-hydroxybenzoate adenylyltransferase